MIFALILQVVAAANAHRAPMTPGDSSALVGRAQRAQYNFIIDWRYQVVWDDAYRRYAQYGDHTTSRHFVPAPAGTLPPPVMPPPPTPDFLKGPDGGCNYEETFRFDIKQNRWGAHLIKNSDNIGYYFCPSFSRAPLNAMPVGKNDYALSVEARDTVRAHRRALLTQLEAAAARLPGDRWLLGQRVRFLIDQGDAQAAARAARTCGTERWWCGLLTGYILDVAGDRASAVRAVTEGYAQMPIDARAEWGDINLLLPYSARNAYHALPIATRDSLDALAWWLADPLFIEDGNDRFVEQLLRRVDVELHNGQVDLLWDWRWNYQGPALAEMFLRYGRPPTADVCTNGMMGGPSMTEDDWPHPTHADNFLGHFLTWMDVGQPLGCRKSPAYPGPQFHTLPAWRAILDPLHVGADDWDLAPKRDVGKYWDGSWWAPEFYLRKSGPLVPVNYQVAMFRRQGNPVLAAAMEWDTVTYTFAPPTDVIAAAITMTGPTAPRIGSRDTMRTDALHGIAATIPSGPSVLSLEMLPRSGYGTAGRARFGIDAPPGLGQLGAGEIALSDLAFVRTAEGQTEPRTATEMLGRMLGSTTVHEPQPRVGVYWEAYGLADGDTVDVSVKVVRQDDANLARRIGTVVGLARPASDSVLVRWREPRHGDPSPTIEAGVSIRPRGVVLGLSQLSPGVYSVEVTMVRGGRSAIARRELTIAWP